MFICSFFKSLYIGWRIATRDSDYNTVRSSSFLLKLQLQHMKVIYLLVTSNVLEAHGDPSISSSAFSISRLSDLVKSTDNSFL